LRNLQQGRQGLPREQWGLLREQPKALIRSKKQFSREEIEALHYVSVMIRYEMSVSTILIPQIEKQAEFLPIPTLQTGAGLLGRNTGRDIPPFIIH